MSSGDEDSPDASGASQTAFEKRRKVQRKVQRACDVCRRKKVRCDGADMPGNRCSNCIAYEQDCTYVEAAKKRGPPKGYVEGLENRVEKLQNLLNRLMPELDFSKETGDSSNNALVPPFSPREVPTRIATSVIRNVNTPISESQPSDDDWDSHVILPDTFHTHSPASRNRFFGKSSGVMLIQAARDLKTEYVKSTQPTPPPPQRITAVREQFWNQGNWEIPSTENTSPKYEFPENQLMDSLVDIYFRNVNIYLPLLHRPSFERDKSQGKHLQDESFGTLLLLVCAIASRYSDDPRVFLDAKSPHSAGWKWFHQVQMVRKSLLTPPNLADLQFFCLSVQFLIGSSAPQACWTMVGVGIRLAQDVGAHRRNAYNSRNGNVLEHELWKRAFWILVVMDRSVSAALGRPPATQDEDFDLDLPIECDDEYWEQPDDPEQAFRQPADKPSIVAYFNCFVKLNQILAIALRTIYSINKSKILMGFVGPQWEQHIVAELDSALNGFIDSVPDHLRWDPNQPNEVFFNQSVSLYASYYHLQILIHRPFISSPRKASPLAFSSLAICTNAARSCSHIVDLYRKRSGTVMINVQMPTFTAAVVLLLNIWGGRRSGLSTDPAKEMADVHKCMAVLRVCEQRWQSAGRLWDILYELASAGDLPLPEYPSSSLKRDRDTGGSFTSIDDPLNHPSSSPAPGASNSRTIVGTKRVAAHGKQKQQDKQVPGIETAQVDAMHNIPLYSNDLGRLPVHGQFTADVAQNFTDPSYWYPDMAGSGSIPPLQPHSQSMAQTQIQPPMDENIAASTFYPTDNQVYFTPDHSLVDGSLAVGSPSYQGHVPQDTMPSLPRGTETRPVLDGEMMEMWSSAPTGFELEDWGTYFNNVSEMTSHQYHQGEPHT